MTTKKTFFITLLFSFAGFVLILLVFWFAGARAFPFGDGSFHSNARQIKPWVIFDKKPSIILVSNSRAVFGYDTGSLKTSKIYNASLTGISVNEILRLVQHSVFSKAGSKHIYIGLDTICDAFSDVLDGGFFDSDYLKSPPKFGHNFKRIRATLGSPLSIVKRIVFDRPGIDENGYSSFFPDKYYQTGSIQQSLRNREQTDYLNQEFTANCDTSAYSKLLEFLYKNELHFTIFMNPKHARNYVAYSLMGTLDSYLWMVNELDLMNTATAKQYGLTPSPLCFFNKINEPTMESFESKDGEFRSMIYWFENSHFKTSLGAIILNDMVSEQRCEEGFQSFYSEFHSSLTKLLKNNHALITSVQKSINAGL